MTNIIEDKRLKLIERVNDIKNILEDLKESNSTFTSSRKLSVYIANKLTKQGKPVDDSTLRRAKSPYKALIDDYVGKKKVAPDIQVKLALKVKLQKEKIETLESRLHDLENIVEDKENQIRLLLIDAQDKRKQVISSITAPKGSTYTQTELTRINELHKRDRAQLEKAFKIIETLLEPELKIKNKTGGSYEIRNGRVIDLVEDSDLFNEESLPDFFKDK